MDGGWRCLGGTGREFRMGWYSGNHARKIEYLSSPLGYQLMPSAQNLLEFDSGGKKQQYFGYF